MNKIGLKILTIICFVLLCAPTGFCEPQGAAPNQALEIVQIDSVSQNNLNEIPDTIPEKNYENLKKIKDSATTSKIFNFLTTLVSIIFAIICLVGGFKLYKKWSNKGYIISAPPKETLATPKDFKSAINLFLGKTDD